MTANAKIDLYLNVSSDFSLSEMEKWLGVDFSKSEIGSKDFAPVWIGGVSIGYALPALQIASPYVQDWRYSLRMQCSEIWTEARLELAIAVYNFALFKDEGYVLAWESDGNAFIYGTSELLSINNTVRHRISERFYFSDEYIFTDLHPVLYRG